MKKIIAILTLAMMLIGLCGCDAIEQIFESDPKTFTEGAFSITLNEDFKEGDADTYEGSYAFYESQYVHVMVMHESYEDLGIDEDDYTLDEYIEAIKEANNRGTASVKKGDGFKFITYSSLEDGETMFYKVAFYKGEEGFYSVSFITPMDNLDQYGEKFDKWAESVDVG